jgi:uncharacterized phage-associated protein
MFWYIKNAVTGLIHSVKHASSRIVNSFGRLSTVYPQERGTIASMSLRFDEEKATQAAAYFLALHNGRMHYFMLVKLLYLADRAALLKWGIPITTDRYAAMKHGPVVSTIYDLIKIPDKPKRFWSEFISPPFGDKEVKLLKPAPTGKLSRAEESLMREVFGQYGHWNRYTLRDFVLHKLPEWTDPGDTSAPITIADILRAGGEDENEIRAIQGELKSFKAVESRLHKFA